MGCILSRVAARFAFFPPSPPTYSVTKRDDGKLAAISAPSPAISSVIPCGGIEGSSCLDVWVLDTKRGNKIVAFYLRNPYARLTLLYSHGNATDLGQLYDLFLQLKINLRVNLMGYDYAGYGASTGKASESNTYADIEAVYECLETEYGVSQEDLILYGQSVGSGPTLHLASRLPRLRGVVLHSAILSGLRVVCRPNFTLCLDMYKGTEDEVVNWLHGNILWKLAREPYDPLWIRGGGHCNLEVYPDYLRHLRKFITEMENITTAVRLKTIRQKLNTGGPAEPPSPCCFLCCTSDCCERPKCPRCCKRPKCPRCCKRPKCPRCIDCGRGGDCFGLGCLRNSGCCGCLRNSGCCGCLRNSGYFGKCKNRCRCECRAPKCLRWDGCGCVESGCSVNCCCWGGRKCPKCLPSGCCVDCRKCRGGCVKCVDRRWPTCCCFRWTDRQGLASG